MKAALCFRAPFRLKRNKITPSPSRYLEPPRESPRTDGVCNVHFFCRQYRWLGLGYPSTMRPLCCYGGAQATWLESLRTCFITFFPSPLAFFSRRSQYTAACMLEEFWQHVLLFVRMLRSPLSWVTAFSLLLTPRSSFVVCIPWVTWRVLCFFPVRPKVILSGTSLKELERVQRLCILAWMKAVDWELLDVRWSVRSLVPAIGLRSPLVLDDDALWLRCRTCVF